MRGVFDTNILVDYLNGVEAARGELSRFGERLISVVTWMEVMVGVESDDEVSVRGFLGGFGVVPVDDAIAKDAVRLRRMHRIRPSDAIIWATARSRKALLVTRNTKDFPAADVGVRVPYRLKSDRAT